MAQVTKSKLAINIVVGVACMPISMAVLAFTFSVANRLFVSDELLSGWHAAWSNPLMLAAVSAVVTFVRLTSNALEEWDRRGRTTPTSGRELRNYKGYAGEDTMYFSGPSSTPEDFYVR